MSATVLRRIAAVLGLAILLWAGLALWRRSARDTADGLTLPRLSPEAVERVSFIRGADTIALTRQGTAWQVNGSPADVQAVTSFLTANTDTSWQSELVSQSAVSHQRLGLDSTGALRLVVTGGAAPALDLFIGGRGPDFEGFYVRRVGQTAAYLVRGNFVEASIRSADEWRDRRILAIPHTEIHSVAVRRGAEGFLLERRASGWTVDGKAADSTTAARYVAQFADVRANGFPAPGQLDGVRFDPPAGEVTVKGADGQVIAALTFAPAEAGFWVRTASGVVYRIDTAAATRIMPAAADLAGSR